MSRNYKYNLFRRSNVKIFFSSVLILLSVLFSQYTNATTFGMIAGDSFSDDGADWHAFVSNATLFSTAVAGQRLVQMPKKFEQDLDRLKLERGINAAIIQGGVNDIRKNGSLKDMQAAVTEMVDAAVQRDLDVFVFNVAPWNNAPNQGKRNEIEVYNTWLDGYTAKQGIHLVDMFAAVADSDNPQRVKSEFNRDGIHLNKDGAKAVAAVFDSEILQASVPNSAPITNEDPVPAQVPVPVQAPVVPSQVPVPGAVWLFFSGLIALFSATRRSEMVS
jgi:hypothetical protein